MCAVSCHAKLCCDVLWCVLCTVYCVVPCYVVLYCVILWFGVVLRRVVVWCIKVIPSKYNLHSDFGKSLSICNSLYVYPRNEI